MKYRRQNLDNFNCFFLVNCKKIETKIFQENGALKKTLKL